MGDIHEGLKALAFEDRIAQLVMAVLYSSNHIEVTHRLGDAKDKPDKQKAIDAARKRLKAEFNAASEARIVPAEHLAFSRDRDVLMRGDYSDKVDDKGEPLNPVMPVSDIDFDTTAVAIDGSNLLMACNYKVRRMAAAGPSWSGRKSNFEYIAFNTISNQSMRLIQQALTAELDDVRANGTDKDKAKAGALNMCQFIGPKVRPEDAQQNAKPHAEMQLLKFLKSVGHEIRDVHVGVSRGCCPACTEWLTKLGALFTRSHEVDPRTSFLAPDEIEVKVHMQFKLWEF